MIVHIVLGKVDDHLSSDETRELSAALDGLGSLPEVQSLSWGPDFSGRGKGFNRGMVVTFSERLALASYLQNPRHVEIVQILNRLMPERLVVDYETESSGISP